VTDPGPCVLLRADLFRYRNNGDGLSRTRAIGPAGRLRKQLTFLSNTGRISAMIKRDAEEKLKRLAEGFPAVSVIGPRQRERSPAALTRFFGREGVAED
jgi:hypothetical protein